MSAKDTAKLETVSDLIQAGEWLFNEQKAGRIDAKTADALNTTLKGQQYLVGKLPLDALKLYLQARIKKIDIPTRMLPPGVGV